MLKKHLSLLFLIFTSVLLGQNADPFADFDAKNNAEESTTTVEQADSVEENTPVFAAPDPLVVGMQNRLHEIESKLLEQKDRENQLLRDILKSQFEREAQDPTAKIRKEMTEQIEANKNAFLFRIDTLENSLAESRDDQVAFSQKVSKMVLIIAAVVIGIGLILLLTLLFMQFKLLSKTTPQLEQEVPLNQLGNEAHKALPSPEANKSALVENPVVRETNEKFLNAVGKLEERIKQMEYNLVSSISEKNQKEAKPLDPVAPSDEEIETLPANTVVEDSTPVSFDSTFTSIHGVSSEFMDKAEPVEQEVAEPEQTFPDQQIDSQSGLTIQELESQGRAYLAEENWEEALVSFEEACNIDEARVDSWVNRGRSLEMLDREDEALENYSRAISINPDLPSPYLYKAALLSRLERFDEAQEFYNYALSRVPLQPGNPAGSGAQVNA